MDDIRAVVAIDFGTTFSGFAYSNWANPEIVTNDIWPQQTGSLKTNTVLQYDSNYQNVIKWGNPALAQKQSRIKKNSISSKPIELFKLHLLGNIQNEKTPLPDQLSYEKAISDYLRELGKLIKDTIATRWCGLTFFEHVLLVICIPAEIDDYAKDTMRKCIYNAELTDNIKSTKIKFITEPEAAAFYCMRTLKEQLIPINASFMVVDCGGITVDLTTRKLLQHNKFSKITERTRDFCGGSYVDREFLKFLSRKFGESTINLLRENNYVQMQYMIQQFCRQFKFNFTGNRSDFNSFEFDIEENCSVLKKHCKDDIKEKMEKDDWIININFEDLKSMFDPVVGKIIRLIRRQLVSNRDKCSAIFLVGGFSESKYLQMRVKEEFGKLISPIIVPKQPIVAIVRGACDYGLKMSTIELIDHEESDRKPNEPEDKREKNDELIWEYREKEKRELMRERDELKRERDCHAKQVEAYAKQLNEIKLVQELREKEKKELMREHDELKRERDSHANQVESYAKQLNEMKLIQELRENEKRVLMKENDELRQSREKEKETYAKQIESNVKQIKALKNEIEDWKYNVNQYEHKLGQYEHDRAKYEQHMMALDEQLKNKRKDYNELYKKNEELRNEASQYQLALANAREDNDTNNPTQLTKDIEMIQDKINEFCKLKGGVEIHEQPLASLLEHYECKQLEPGDKALPKAALQRFIIETIFRKTDEYLLTQQKEINDYKMIQDSDKVEEKYFELKVLNSTNEYLSIVNNLIHSRKGIDEVSFAAPKKIRQLVNAVLGDRGFGSNNKGEHDFIQDIKNEIIAMMNNYRTIKKAEKKQENEDMIADIVKNVIKMFVFRIRVLEPPGEIEWITNGSKIDPTLMEIGNLEDDNYDDWVVNLCSFPLIYVKSETDRKVLVPAKIFPIKAEQKRSLFKQISILRRGKRTQQPEADEYDNQRNSTNPRFLSRK